MSDPDKIDLDELTDEEDDEEGPPRGSWLWRDDGDADDPDAPPAESVWSADNPVGGDGSSPDSDGDDDDDGDGDDDDDIDAKAETADPPPAPRVPRESDDRPVGIPMEGGGAGGAAAADRNAADSTGGEADATETGSASGPHGGGADEMTMAITYGAIKRLGNVQAALADANTWTDWVGLVGDVDAHVLNKYQRDNRLDLDFFNGTGTGPGERLAKIDEHSMFYAERMVVVGVEGEDEYVAEESGWEFVPVETAAEEAGWELADREDL